MFRKGLILIAHNGIQRYNLPGKVSDNHKLGADHTDLTGLESKAETVSILSTFLGLILGTRALCIGNFQMLTLIQGTQVLAVSWGTGALNWETRSDPGILRAEASGPEGD